MSLKDQIAADISTVFFNTAEFADEHNINGQTMVCVTDEDLSRQYSNRQSDDYDGIYARQLTVFVREVDLGYRPERGQKMTVDSEWYLVMDCAASDGLLEITLGANRA